MDQPPVVALHFTRSSTTCAVQPTPAVTCWSNHYDYPHQVAELYRSGKIQEINDYCLHDVLDTYFIFLRTRVLTGEITLEEEQGIVAAAREWIAAKATTQPSLLRYLEYFGAWDPTPFR